MKFVARTGFSREQHKSVISVKILVLHCSEVMKIDDATRHFNPESGMLPIVLRIYPTTIFPRSGCGENLAHAHIVTSNWLTG